ncbi:hypothetical protein ACFQ1M_06615 [Sungkyunkwania multivorans]|uniref:YhhN-like protein n=1 Tax=Sungkyunkwania multivorans TaxID=1173618 RepID=A0ABW3CZ26_9FLAO
MDVKPVSYLLLFIFGTFFLVVYTITRDDYFYTFSKPLFIGVILCFYLVTSYRQIDLWFIFSLLFLGYAGAALLYDNANAHFQTIVATSLGYLIFLRFAWLELRKIPRHRFKYRDLPIVLLLITLLFYIVYSNSVGSLGDLSKVAFIHGCVVITFSSLAFFNFLTIPTKRAMWLMFVAIAFILGDVFFLIYEFQSDILFIRQVNYIARITSHIFMLRFIMAK